MRRIVILVTVGLLFATGVSASVILEADMGTTRWGDVGLAELDSVTSGAGSWTQSWQFDTAGNRRYFVNDEDGSNTAFYWRNDDGLVHSNIRLTFDEPLDFTEESITISYDMGYELPPVGTTDTSLYFRVRDQFGAGVQILDVDYLAQRGANIGRVVLDPSDAAAFQVGEGAVIGANNDLRDADDLEGYPTAMANFSFTFSGNVLSYTITDSGGISHTGTTDIDISDETGTKVIDQLVFGMANNPTAMYLDNISVIPEPTSVLLLAFSGLFLWVAKKRMK